MGYTPPQTSPVEAVNVLLAFDDPDILTGKVVYQAQAGDVIDLNSFLAIYQSFDGNNTALHLRVDGEPSNDDDILNLSVAASVDGPYKDSGGLHKLYGAVAGGTVTGGIYFQRAATLIVFMDDDAGGDPGCTQGLAELRLSIRHRANAQPSRPVYPITDANASQQWFKIDGIHIFDFNLDRTSSGVAFAVAGSTANDGSYLPVDVSRNITAIDQLTNSIVLGGMSHTSLRLPPGTVFFIASSTGNDGTYTVDTATDLTSTVTTVEPLPDPTADGIVQMPAAVYLSGETKTLIWVVGSSIADDTGDGTIEL